MTRILIVDEHPLYSNGLSALLQQYFPNAHVLQSGCAREASLIARHYGSLDWVFLDCILSDCNVIECLKSLRKTLAGVDIVLTSASAQMDLVCEALDCGARGFLSKTESPADVHSCLQKISAGEIYLSSDMQRKVRHHRSNLADIKRRLTRQISKRQQEVLLLLSAGYSNAEIAAALGISPHTVKDHVSNIMQLLDADNRVHCITEARQLGLSS